MSNIAWPAKYDSIVYAMMKEYGFEGLEIAPTKIFPSEPYEHLAEAQRWAKGLYDQYGFVIPSMQSIWFGRSEKLFGTEEERDLLFTYTKKAIDFATAIHCSNLVFGCPKNRVLPEGTSPEPAVDFFRRLGDYAAQRGTVIGMEANPTIYHTNYINDTKAALELIRQVDSKGFLLNLDIGTMIQNGESAELLRGNVRYINHVHISEPGLCPIAQRKLHREIRTVLETENYSGFVSIEMKELKDFQRLRFCVEYVKGWVFR